MRTWARWIPVLALAAGCGGATPPAAAPAASDKAQAAAPVPATFDVAELAARVTPTVVNITATRVGAPIDDDEFEFFFSPGQRDRRRSGVGTGFIIEETGLIVTNAHVVFGADDVRVRLSDGRELKASIVGSDVQLDLALLQARGASGLPAVKLGQSNALRVGEHVLAVGNPYGLAHTVTLGIVSAKARTIGAGPYDDFIQTDASINPGNSGGPLFNWKGEVVGINTAIRPGANSIGFAIPIDALRDVLPQLRNTGRITRGKLGVVFQPISYDLAKALGMDTPRGALVAEIEPGGSAQRAGVRQGDVVVAINGQKVEHAEDLPRTVARNPPGSSVKVSVVRKGQALEFTAKLDALVDRTHPPPPAQPRGGLGFRFGDAGGLGARVEAIDGSAVRDLEPGDVIIEFNGSVVRDSEVLRVELAKARPGSMALLKVRRNRGSRYAAVPIPDAPR